MARLDCYHPNRNFSFSFGARRRQFRSPSKTMMAVSFPMGRSSRPGTKVNAYGCMAVVDVVTGCPFCFGVHATASSPFLATKARSFRKAPCSVMYPASW
jgi:hypothetical protein